MAKSRPKATQPNKEIAKLVDRRIKLLKKQDDINAQLQRLRIEMTAVDSELLRLTADAAMMACW